MPEGYPVQANQLREFYAKIAPLVESSGLEPQLMIREWNAQLFQDMRSEAEVIMLMHGQGASDRFLYGLCSAVAAVREENGGILPELRDGQYELDKEVQDSHQAAQDDSAAKYFSKIEEIFEQKFPLTSMILAIMENDLRTRLRAPETDIQEGFIPGWYKAVKVAMPLFMDDTPENS